MATTKTPCVILDTNVWMKERLLRDGVGQALIRSLNLQQGRIGLPEVVERELLRCVQREGQRLIKVLSESLRATVHFTGSDSYRGIIPTVSTFELGLANQLSQLEGLLHRIPFTHTHSSSALDRVLAKLPPCLPNSDEFRDCFIWEAVVETTANFDVHLVSRDKGFYQDADFKKGLVENLAEECQRSNTTIHIYEDIASYLKTLPREEPKIPWSDIEKKIEMQMRSEAETVGLPAKNGLGIRLASQIHPFPTEDPNVYAIQFRQEFQVPGGFEGEGKIYEPAKLAASGNCTYSITSTDISDMNAFDFDLIVEGSSPQVLKSSRYIRLGGQEIRIGSK